MNDLQHRKSKLHSLEDRFKSLIESDSDEMENNLKTYLKVGVIVGVSLFTTYKVYRLISPKEKKDKKKSAKEKESRSSGLMYNAKQRVFAVAATLLYEQFKKLIKEGQKNVEQSISEDSPVN